MSRILASFIVFCVFLLTSCQSQHNSKPIVISTIKPIQALVYAVAGGEQYFQLHQLLPDGASPHHYALKPSDASLLEQAKAVFYIGNGLETFMAKPLSNLPTDTQVNSLGQVENIQHLYARAVHHHEGEEDNAGEANTLNEDMHIWLNPENGIAMANSIANTLSKIDPTHASIFQQNAAQLIQKIQAKDQQLKTELQNLQNKSYLSFHDAWQHFDKHYGLNFAGAVTLDVSRLPGAKHVGDIRHVIEEKQAVCLFQEPQFSPDLIKTLTEGSNIHLGELDPLGMKLPLDENTYINLLQQAADSFAHCLQP